MGKRQDFSKFASRTTSREIILVHRSTLPSTSSPYQSIAMITRSSIARLGHQGLRCVRHVPCPRTYATAASGSFNYDTSEAAGVKIASRDMPGPTAHLAVVARAGTRFQPLPGYSEALDKFAFKATNRRSALRIQREAELLGARLSSYHTRENLVIEAEFIREDLAYFTELLGEIISQTKYSRISNSPEWRPLLTFRSA